MSKSKQILLSALTKGIPMSEVGARALWLSRLTDEKAASELLGAMATGEPIFGVHFVAQH